MNNEGVNNEGVNSREVDNEEDDELFRFSPRPPQGGRNRRDPQDAGRGPQRDLRDANWEVHKGPRDADSAERAQAFAKLRQGREARERESGRPAGERVSRHREQCGQPPRRVRGLSVADIVATAIAVADAEGTEAVSMRRIAREMRVGAMSLYWYVSSKDELIRLMLDALEGENEVPEPSGNWRADLRATAWDRRSVMLRHPWTVDVLGIAPPYGPNDARNADRLFGALDGLGLPALMTVNIMMAVGTHVVGAVLSEIQEIRAKQDRARATAGRSAREISAAEITVAREAFAGRLGEHERYPHLARMASAGIDPDAPQARDERFEFGLDCLLDGIAARVSSRAATPPVAQRPPSAAPRIPSASPTEADE